MLDPGKPIAHWRSEQPKFQINLDNLPRGRSRQGTKISATRVFNAAGANRRKLVSIAKPDRKCVIDHRSNRARVFKAE